MRPETLALVRTNRAAQLGIAAAVLATLVVAAMLVDALSSKPVVNSREKGVSAAQAKPARELALDGPLMPHYSAPQPPPAGPDVPDQPRAPAAVVAEARSAIAKREAPAPAPAAAASRAPEPPPPAPRFPTAQPEPARVAAAPAPRPAPPSYAMPAQTAAPAPGYCARCGEVIALTVWPDMTEVHVRFQDGSTHAMRSGVPARWRVGDRVRAEGGRLVAD